MFKRLLTIILLLGAIVQTTLAQYVNDGFNPFLREEPEEPTILILTSPDLLEQCEKLALWKTKLGFKVDILCKNRFQKFDDWYNDVINRIGFNKAQYIFIVGDTTCVPSRKIFTDIIEDKQYWTDFYYGCNTPEFSNKSEVVPVGRIFGRWPGDIGANINSIIDHEQNPPTNSEYYKRAVFLATYQDKDADYAEDQGFIYSTEMVASLLDNNYSKRSVRFYENDSTVLPRNYSNIYGNGQSIPNNIRSLIRSLPVSESEMVDTINKGTFLLVYHGHGKDDAWCKPYFWGNTVGQLQNQYQLPIVLSSACNTSEMGSDKTDFFGKVFSQGKTSSNELDSMRCTACIAFIGSSNLGFSGFSDLFEFGFMDALWPSKNWEFQFNHGLQKNYKPTYTTHEKVNHLGLAINQGRHRMYEHYQANSYYVEYMNYCSFSTVLFGDPSLVVYTEAPTKFSEPDISVSLVDNNLTYTIKSSEAERITIYRDGTLDNWTVKSTEMIDQSVEYGNDYWVSLTGPNKIPFFKKLPVVKKDEYIQNTTLAGKITINGNAVKIGSDVDTGKPSGKVTIVNSDLNITCSEIEIHPYTEIDNNTTIHINFE